MKAALSQYEVDIRLSPDTLQALMATGYSLLVLKAVQTHDGGAAPLVWFRTDRLTLTTSVTWQEQYQAYISPSQIVSNGMIHPGATVDISVGQTAQVSADGVMTATDGGATSAISIFNQDYQTWTCGVSQVVAGQANPVCAVQVISNMVDIITPVEQVLLMFSNMSMNTGTVMVKASTFGLLVDLRDATQRTVQFDINNGWTWGGGAWGHSVAPNANLLPLLIQTS